MESLALKYRPASFEDVSGQTYTVKSLKNAIEMDFLSHAYLFFGSRGVGKTSMARIMARSLNCAQGPTSSPCGECHNCSEISLGNSPDVIEMDAASNRGIQHIRELRDNTRFSPMKSKYKIYIIDEVHMLTNESFNALLKTLEEPPPHVVFILATTEKHKIPETILSRCQNFVFRKFTHEEIVSRLKVILSKEKIKFEESALLPIAQKAEGSMRDAISLLDQALAYSNDREVLLEEVQVVLGLLPFETYCQTLASIRKRSLNDILLVIERAHEEGYHLKQFLWDLLELIKNAYLIKIGSDGEKKSMLSESQYAALSQEADLWDQEMLRQAFNDLYEIYSNSSIFQGVSSNEMRVSLEMAVISLLQKFEQPSVAKLTQKILQLKNAIEKGENFQDNSAKDHTPQPAQPTPQNQKAKVQQKEAVKKVDEMGIDTMIQKEFMGNHENSKEITDLFKTTSP